MIYQQSAVFLRHFSLCILAWRKKTLQVFPQSNSTAKRAQIRRKYLGLCIEIDSSVYVMTYVRNSVQKQGKPLPRWCFLQSLHCRQSLLKKQWGWLCIFIWVSHRFDLRDSNHAILDLHQSAWVQDLAPNLFLNSSCFMMNKSQILQRLTTCIHTLRSPLTSSKLWLQNWVLQRSILEASISFLGFKHALTIPIPLIAFLSIAISSLIFIESHDRCWAVMKWCNSPYTSGKSSSML